MLYRQQCVQYWGTNLDPERHVQYCTWPHIWIKRATKITLHCGGPHIVNTALQQSAISTKNGQKVLYRLLCIYILGFWYYPAFFDISEFWVRFLNFHLQSKNA